MAIEVKAWRVPVGFGAAPLTAVSIMVTKNGVICALPLMLQQDVAEELFGKEVCDRLPEVPHMMQLQAGAPVKLTMEIL